MCLFAAHFTVERYAQTRVAELEHSPASVACSSSLDDLKNSLKISLIIVKNSRWSSGLNSHCPTDSCTIKFEATRPDEAEKRVLLNCDK